MAQEQRYYEGVAEGEGITPLLKKPSNVQLFLFSVATHNTHSIHYSKDQAIADGHKDVVVQGNLHAAFLCQMVTDWMGDRGFLKKFSYSNREVAFAGDVLTCKGKVIKKFVKGGDHLVECEIWNQNQRGEVCTQGSCLVVLPSSGQRQPLSGP